MKIIDLRSDTVTKPSEAMRICMAKAQVGDDVFDDDPTVQELQNQFAAKVGKEASLFVPSGTQSNLLALLSHCQRGDEVILGLSSHMYKWEGGGISQIAHLQPLPLKFQDDGTLNLQEVKSHLKGSDIHHVRSRLLCLENTLNGQVLPFSYLYEAREFANAHNLLLHLDGARAFNAAVKLNKDIKEICAPFDSISICLSKGLGAPVGSILSGSKEFIAKARRFRKTLGGGMRQVGILAAAGLYAINHNIARLGEDHENAAYLANALKELDEVHINSQQTNMIFLDFKTRDAQEVITELRKEGILALAYPTMRLVLHLDITREDVERVIAAFKKVLI